jgi:hypothetical protein
MAAVRLSRRNLLSLLHKLEMQGSAKTLIKGDDVEAFVAELEMVLERTRQEGRL